MLFNKNVKHLADFGKCAVRVAQQRAQHVPVKNLMERSKSDSGYEVKCKGFEPPIIQEADFGKSGAESGTRPSEQTCNERQNLVKDLKRMQGCEPPIIQDGEEAQSAKGGSTNNMAKNKGLLRFARNDGKFLVPQCLRNLVPFRPLSLPSPSRGEGCNDVNNLSTYPLINLSTYKRKDFTTMIKNKNVKKTLEAGVLTKRHSEGIRPKNLLHTLKRFFAKYKFPFAGNSIKPAQNGGKILTPLTQDPTPKSKISTLSHTARSFTRLASSSVQLVPQGAGIHVMHLADFGKCAVRVAEQHAQHVPVKNLMERSNSDSGYEVECKGFEQPIIQDFTHSPIHLFTPKKTGLLRRFAPRNDGKLLVPQCLSNLVPFCSLAPCGRGQGEGLNPCKKKAAFTLAEVLITLGIIGVVAAMTIPTLITAHQKKVTATKLQKAIAELTQAYRLSYDDVGDISLEGSLDMGGKKYFDTYLAPYLKVSTYCTKENNACGYGLGVGFPGLNGGYSGLHVYDKSDNRTAFLTTDGFLFIILVGSVGSGTENRAVDHIYVDINGTTGPNIMGRDTFRLQRVIDEKGINIFPYGYDFATSVVDAECSASGTGFTCAEKIRRAGWKIEKDYPWK